MTDIELKNLKDNLWHSADMLRAGAHLVSIQPLFWRFEQ